MAFAKIQDADTTSGGTTSGSTTVTLTYPANIAAGDLLVAIVALSANASLSGWPSGWIVIRSNISAPSFAIAYKIADGSETGTFNLTASASSLNARVVYRITGWHGTTAPEASTPSTLSSTANPDPPSEDPANWASEDTLWLAICEYADGRRTVSSYPASYTNGLNPRGNNASGVGIGVARRELNASSEDPGTFTISTAVNSRGVTVAIRPAAITFHPKIMRQVA